MCVCVSVISSFFSPLQPVLLNESCLPVNLIFFPLKCAYLRLRMCNSHRPTDSREGWGMGGGRGRNGEYERVRETWGGADGSRLFKVAREQLLLFLFLFRGA